MQKQSLLLLPYSASYDIIAFQKTIRGLRVFEIILQGVMPFYPEDFRNAVADGSSKHLLTFLKRLIFSMRHDREPVFLLRVMSQLAAILKDQGESPILKLKSTRFIMYLILLGEVEVYEHMKEEIYPILRNASLYNRNQPLITRGIDFFKNNKYTGIATFEEKAKIKNIGCKYIVFCLECIYVLSQWLPNEPNNKHVPSLFRLTYQNLVKEGVQFPSQEDFAFFSEERIQQIQQEIKQCQQQIQKASSSIDSEYFDSLRSKNDIEMMNGVEYLQKRLKEKDKIISEMRSNNSVNEVNWQSAIEKQRENEQTYINKIEVYEHKIAELTEEVRNMKMLLKQTDTQELKKCQEIIKQLQSQVNLLTLQNQQLREQLAKSNSIVSASSIQKSKPISSKRFFSPRQKQYNYLKQLLEIESQPNECDVKSKKSLPKQEFFSYQQAKQPFTPYIDTYSKQQVIRLKKSILKNKEVLFKSRQIEVGVITACNNQIQVELSIIITNLCDKVMMIHEVSCDYPSDVAVIGIGESRTTVKKLKPGQQHKQEIKVVVNNIDARCVMMVLEYQQDGLKSEKMALILPVSKFKLVKIVSYTSHPKDWSQIQRIFTPQRKILNHLDKLKEYFPKCYVEAGSVQKTYNLKCEFLQTNIFVSLCSIGQDSLRLMVKFNNENRCLAEKLLNQLLFILSK